MNITIEFRHLLAFFDFWSYPLLYISIRHKLVGVGTHRIPCGVRTDDGEFVSDT